MSLLKIKNLEKSYKEAGGILKDVSLNIEKGEVVVILGPSGCGKSTLLRCINGLESIQGGEILLDDEVISNRKNDMHLIRQKIGMVFQSPCLFEHLKVIDNATFALDCKGFPKKQRHEIGQTWLERFGISELETRYPVNLSGGEAQRVSLVRTLIAEPKIVLFDEPFSALDTPLRKKLTDDLKTWQKELGFTAILVTHDIEEAKKLGDKIIVLKSGQITWEGLPEEFEEELL